MGLMEAIPLSYDKDEIDENNKLNLLSVDKGTRRGASSTVATQQEGCGFYSLVIPCVFP